MPKVELPENGLTIYRYVNYPEDSTKIIYTGAQHTLYTWGTEAAIEWALSHVGDSWIDDTLNNKELYGFDSKYNCT